MKEKTPSSSLSSHPLFSTLLTFYTLVLIYFPSFFLPIVFSPVLISTAILLFALLRLGSIQRTENEFISSEDPKWVSLESNYESRNENSVVLSANLVETEVGSGSDQNIFYVELTEDPKWVSVESNYESGNENSVVSSANLIETEVGSGSDQNIFYVELTEDPKWVSVESNYESGNENSVVSSTNLIETEMGSGSGSDQSTFYVESFIEWDVRAPLEVIYEEYEGEEEDVRNEKAETTTVSSIERYGSLSLYYPESDSDGSSDGENFAGFGGWDSPESMCFMWDEEKGEELIEIAFEGKRTSGVVHFEEENLIEIDISPARC